jgi:hypothetical protein
MAAIVGGLMICSDNRQNEKKNFMAFSTPVPWHKNCFEKNHANE